MNHEKFKVKYNKAAEHPERILLAFSGGLSSLVLLDIMVSLLKEQKNMHRDRQGFELLIVAIDESNLKAFQNNISDIITLLATYMDFQINYKILDINDFFADLHLLKTITIDEDYSAWCSVIQHDKTYTYQDIVNMCPDKSSAEDVLSIIFGKLLLMTAEAESCQTIIYANSMTRLANEVLAMIVRGRGAEVHQKVTDSVQKYNGKEIEVIFPLRDVLFAEVEAYAHLAGLESYMLQEENPKSGKIIRNMTVRDLTTGYFKNLDATGYASTASTVVKTAEKLGETRSKQDRLCLFCGTDLQKDPEEWLRNITVSQPAPLVSEEDHNNYAEYLSSNLSRHNDALHDQRLPLGVCYGCMVTLRGGGSQANSIVWPVAESTSSDQKVLDEYIILDE